MEIGCTSLNLAHNRLSIVVQYLPHQPLWHAYDGKGSGYFSTSSLTEKRKKNRKNRKKTEKNQKTTTKKQQPNRKRPKYKTKQTKKGKPYFLNRTPVDVHLLLHRLSCMPCCAVLSLAPKGTFCFVAFSRGAWLTLNVMCRHLWTVVPRQLLFRKTAQYVAGELLLSHVVNMLYCLAANLTTTAPPIFSSTTTPAVC